MCHFLVVISFPPVDHFGQERGEGCGGEGGEDTETDSSVRDTRAKSVPVRCWAASVQLLGGLDSPLSGAGLLVCWSCIDSNRRTDFEGS